MENPKDPPAELKEILAKLTPTERLELAERLERDAHLLRQSVKVAACRRYMRLPEKIKNYSPRQLRRYAERLRALAELADLKSVAMEAGVDLEAVVKLTPAEKRYCKLEGIKQKDFLKRKCGE